MSFSVKRAALAGVFATLGASLASGCSSDDPARKGQLMLVIKTDMDVPKDVSAVRIEVLAGGIPRHSLDYELGPDEAALKLPGTLAIVAGDNPSLPVKIRVVAYSGNVPKVVREAVTTVPSDRIATLPLAISWLCWEQATTPPPPSATERPNSEATCSKPGDTCSAGTCVGGEIESSTLPTYSPELVYGGAGGPGGVGTCFDTLACFADGVLVPVDLGDCSIEEPAQGSEDLNVALLLQPGGQGICNGSTCLVPLDSDPAEGWASGAAGRLKLPGAVCQEILSGDVLGVATSSVCSTKTPAIPTCGPWSSVTSLPGTFDGGAAFDGPDPCFRTAGDDGAHCGTTLDADPQLLYTCSGGQTTATTPCSAGCSVNNAGDDSCASDGGVDAPVDADASTAMFGAICAGATECGALTCVLETSMSFAGEGPPGGLCTRECTGNPGACAELNSPCVELGDVDYCLQSCAIGTPGNADCGGRADMACKHVSLVTGGVATVCVPICGSDADCGSGQRCNFSTGQCTTAPPGTGALMGQFCSLPEGGTDAGSGCADGLCQEFKDVAGGSATLCSGLCTLSSSSACNWNGQPVVDGGPPNQVTVCLLPEDPAGVDGDLGYCTSLCNDECNDCHPSFGCQFFNNPALEQKYGALGFCAPYWTIDGGVGC